MNKNQLKCDLLLIGAGLTGLAIAYRLRDKGLNIQIVESRDRVGGRILTLNKEDNPVEMGATWLGGKHGNLVAILEELGLETFEQVIGSTAIYEAISTSPPYLAKLPPNPEPSLRVKGGTISLIDALIDRIDDSSVSLNNQVIGISKTVEGVKISTIKTEYEAKVVVSTLPPNLFFSNIKCTPLLPKEVIEIASKTHTWMGESIKIALTYDTPFWRADHLSGTIMSNVGPIPEMYDHSNYQDNSYSLMGFLNGGYHQLTKDERLSIIMNQLTKYFGDDAIKFTSYDEVVWRNEKHTFVNYDSNVLPHQLNGHPVYQKSYLDDSLILAGTETSAHYSGYMEGAIYSANKTAEKISALFTNSNTVH